MVSDLIFLFGLILPNTRAGSLTYRRVLYERSSSEDRILSRLTSYFFKWMCFYRKVVHDSGATSPDVDRLPIWTHPERIVKTYTPRRFANNYSCSFIDEDHVKLFIPFKVALYYSSLVHKQT